MASDRWTRAKNIFNAMLDTDPEDPHAWITDRCGDDTVLLAEVESLWRAYENGPLTNDAEAADWLGADVSEGNRLRPEPAPRPDAGSRIGAYRLTEEIGVGGMSVVYRAERADAEYEQTVAVKLLQRRLHTGDAEQRIRAERQVLASLDHPNIARLLDGGVTDGGRPYLVMDYVDGLPITEYAESNDLPLNARLDLLMQVADAVQAAHGSLVVHRDLKPSNVLVTETGKGPQVKLLDFGIAKLMDDSLPVTRPVTATGHHFMTPSYAAPEQTTAGEITAATDVYQLGVLAYELLSGTRPFDVRDKRLTEIERIVVEEEPSPPSGQTTNGGVSPRQLEGDLDTIVMKALRKEPGRRYRSMETLAADVQRYRARQPIAARPETLRYRTSKFLRRHRWGIGTTAVIVALVAIAMVVVIQERNQAQREAQKSEQVSAFLTDLFEAPDPNHSKGDTLTAQMLLRRGRDRLNQLEDEPAVKAEMTYVLGQSHRRLAHYEAADTLLRQSFAQRSALHGSTHPSTLESLSALALLHRDQGNYPTADTLLQKVVTGRRALRGSSDPSVVKALMYRSFVQRRRSDLSGAAQSIREALAAKREQGGNADMLTAELLFNRAAVLRQQGEYETALSLQRRSLDLARRLTEGPHPGVVANLGNLAILQHRRRRSLAADSLYQLAIEEAKALYGSNHPETALWMGNLGTVYVEQFQYAKADSILRKTLAVNRSAYESPHPRIVYILSNLAKNHYRRGWDTAADSTYRTAVRMAREVYASSSLQFAQLSLDYGQFLIDTGRLDSAETYVRKSMEAYRTLRPAGHPDRARAMLKLGTLRFRQGDLVLGDSLARRALNIYQQGDDPSTGGVGRAHRLQGRIALRRGDLGRADSHFEAALQAFQSSEGAPVGSEATVQALQGVSETKRVHYANAEPLLTRSLETLRRVRGHQNAFTKETEQALISLYEVWDRPELAAEIRQKGRSDNSEID